jgi:clan AA aspartic protease
MSIGLPADERTGIGVPNGWSIRSSCHAGSVGYNEAVMGLTYVTGTVRGPRGTRRVRFLVDSGATYSLLPAPVWKAIGLRAKKTMAFTLADGTEIRRDVSECRVALRGEDGHSPVILGDAGDAPLLGAVTLEVMGMVLNPFNRTLQPMRAVLAGQRTRD